MEEALDLSSDRLLNKIRAINKCTTVQILQNFYHHYLCTCSTSDIGIFCHINVTKHEECSSKVKHSAYIYYLNKCYTSKGKLQCTHWWQSSILYTAEYTDESHNKGLKMH